MSTSKMITLRSSDGDAFQVSVDVALQSQTIKHMVADNCAENGIPLANVTSEVLAKVIEYFKKHVQCPKGEELKAWDAEFVKVEQPELFDLILAANYLNIKDLMELTCQTVADMFTGKTAEEIRKTFNIKNDYTPEEEEEIRSENQWNPNRASILTPNLLFIPFLLIKISSQLNLIMSTSKMITLRSSDGDAFEVSEAVALQSLTIKHMVEDDCAENGIPLPNVTRKVLAKVIEHCRKHAELPKGEELKAWDAEFVKGVLPELFDIILAANYLNINNLLDLTNQTVADMITGK
ncbi:hypothetical protein MKW94_018605 [Papaver nudicaule]|uniref:SKP1-like protein n=1 Tax=Papaver nudicaule TaxID=74823 RepID=A0AA42ATN8_PAPNU|nr:hypothetical protein [Papaver nudicaule]